VTPNAAITEIRRKSSSKERGYKIHYRIILSDTWIVIMKQQSAVFSFLLMTEPPTATHNVEIAKGRTQSDALPMNARKLSGGNTATMKDNLCHFMVSILPKT